MACIAACVEERMRQPVHLQLAAEICEARRAFGESQGKRFIFIEGLCEPCRLRSGDDIRGQLVFDEADLVAQDQFALF